MPFTKHKHSPSGKKQVSIPGPNSAAYKKLASHNAASANSAPKTANVSKAFSSMRSRQRIVELVKRAIWAKVREINDSVINLALAGNYQAAKALFEFAGVYSLPAPDDQPSAPAVAAPVPSTPAPAPDLVDPINAFFRSIGVEPPGSTPSEISALNA
jgi:hypothetical protein